jgi:MbtH protein
MDDDRIYRVMVNDEDQYSIWPADKPVPAGWRPVAEPGSKASCLSYITEVWTDMRPRSGRGHGAQGSR